MYLAISTDPESPVLDAAGQSATEAGYQVNYGPGSLGCDTGAPEALDASNDTSTVEAYFDTQAKAEQARAAFLARDQDVLAVVHVTTYCLD